MMKMNFNKYLPIRIVAALAIVVSGCETPEPQDPRVFIPGPQDYYNLALEFSLRYPVVLNLEVEDRGVADEPGIYLKLQYPGNDHVVFELETHDPGMIDHLRRGLVDGSDKVEIVGGETGSRFEVEAVGGEDGPEQHVVVERSGWLYVFTGKGESFDEVLESFRFIDSQQPEEDQG